MSKSPALKVMKVKVCKNNQEIILKVFKYKIPEYIKMIKLRGKTSKSSSWNHDVFFHDVSIN